jgi:prepilin-type N-terminal cleavage/methylation domain-containing protein
MKKSSITGFTLIELLVVITIIGLLASTVLASVSAARAKSRDAARISQIREVQKALELYYIRSGAYPNWSGSTPRANSCFSNGDADDGVAEWSTALGVLVTNGVISKLPIDPLNKGVVGLDDSNPDYCYGYYRQNISSIWDQCKNTKTGEVYDPKDYEYFLYFSLEHPSNWNITLDWGGETIKPFNACLVGPHR